MEKKSIQELTRFGFVIVLLAASISFWDSRLHEVLSSFMSPTMVVVVLIAAGTLALTAFEAWVDSRRARRSC